MTRSSSLPVVAIGRDQDGLPTRLSVPGLNRTVPVVLAGRRLGQVDPSGKVTWTGPGGARSWSDYLAAGDALREAARARKRLRASIIDGNVAAVVVPKRRAPKAKS